MFLSLNKDGDRGQYSHDVIVERAIDFLAANRDRPCFRYVPVTIPHVELAVPADPLARYLGRFPEVGGGQERRIGYIVSPNPRATYAAMVSRLDRDVGRILDPIRSLGIDENTVVIFNSDDGALSRFDVKERYAKGSQASVLSAAPRFPHHLPDRRHPVSGRVTSGPGPDSLSGHHGQHSR